MASKRQPAGTRKRFHGFRFITTFLAILVGFEIVGGTVGLIGLNGWLKGTPDLDVNDFFTQESTLIFDAEGNEIADIGMQLRENITYDQIPEALVDAFLAIEDSRYWTHNGFDIPRFTKAVIETFTNHNMQGGSTFTMQLVKMTYFMNDESGTSRTKDVEYKVQQIALAIELEKHTTKKEIFEMYMNKLNFGGIGNIRGIQKACQQYFGKNVWEIGISEAALMSGIVNSPYYYDPHWYLENATYRRDEVLYQMWNHGYIDDEEYLLAESIKVEDLLVDPYGDSDGHDAYQYQAYIDEVVKEAERVTGQDPLTVSMEIYTAMDPTVQSAIEDIQAGRTYIQYFDDYVENAIISENNQTGEIVGIGGGRNYARGGSMLLNHATDQYNQPGSTVKPILDYLLAFEYLGWATDHVVVDQPVAYGSHVFTNAGTDRYRGQLKIDAAIGWSLNTPAIQALQSVMNEIGTDKVADYLESIGLSRFNRENLDIMYAIGAGTMSVSAKELMAAHAVNMNGGNYIEPHTIKRIVYRSGLQDPLEPQYTPRQVVSSQAAYLMSTILERNVSYNWMNYMQLLQRGYPVYAKTGTTDYGDAGLSYGIPYGAAKDSWMVCETSNYTTAVWIGYEKPLPVEECATWIDEWKGSQNMCGEINNYMLDILNRNEWPAGVGRPDGISDITHILATFPYAAPIEGMPGEYITTGMVKSEYAKLAAPESKAALQSLATFNSGVNDDMSEISFSWSKYPDADKLQVAPSSMSLVAKDAYGNILASAYGTRLFDYSWVWGPVRYKARISQNGQTVKEITSEEESHSEPVSGLEYDTETQVCGFYAYETSGDSSNEVCTTFVTPRRRVIAPDMGASVFEILNWGANNGLTLNYTIIPTDSKHPDGTIDKFTQDGYSIYGQEIDPDLPLVLVFYSDTDPYEDNGEPEE